MRRAEIAIRAGVDLLAHLPGYSLERDEDQERYLISESAARLAGQQAMSVTPNAWLAARRADGDSIRLEQIRELQRRNLRLLERHGVRVVVGSDQFGSTARNEVTFLEELGLWNSLELLRMWAVTTPKLIFPSRRIGKLTSGYEATLLVVECNPVEELGCVDSIRLRMKQGTWIE